MVLANEHFLISRINTVWKAEHLAVEASISTERGYASGMDRTFDVLIMVI